MTAGKKKQNEKPHGAMGSLRFVITGRLAWLGWLTTAAMAAGVAGMAISWMT